MTEAKKKKKTQAIDDRHKTDLRVPQELWNNIEVISKDTLGVAANAFFSIAAAKFAVEMSQILPTKSRREVLKQVKDEFQKIYDKAWNAASPSG